MKATLIDMVTQIVAMWQSFLDEKIDQMDKFNFMVDICSMWFIGQILLFVGIGAAYRMPYPFIGALLCFVLAILSVIFTIMGWESGKYVWKNGKDGYKHNRQQT